MAPTRRNSRARLLLFALLIHAAAAAWCGRVSASAASSQPAGGARVSIFVEDTSWEPATAGWFPVVVEFDCPQASPFLGRPVALFLEGNDWGSGRFKDWLGGQTAPSASSRLDDSLYLVYELLDARGNAVPLHFAPPLAGIAGSQKLPLTAAGTFAWAGPTSREIGGASLIRLRAFLVLGGSVACTSNTVVITCHRKG